VGPTVGIIANPVSARDIRRVIARAANLQIADRANIVLRILASLRACGVERVLMMPEKGGICAHIERQLAPARNSDAARFPVLDYVPIRVSGTVADTHRATEEMVGAGVDAIVVLGGDGTHRAVASRCNGIPIAGVSTGTNNAFPDHREPTVIGLAAGLAATAQVPPEIAFAANKRIEVRVNDDPAEIALVDVAIVSERHVGARALWRTDNFRELFVAFAEPQAIGLSALAGLLEPVARDESGGLRVRMAPIGESALVLRTPIAPGLIEPIGIGDWCRMPAGQPFAPGPKVGTIALDGERELSFSERDRVAVSIQDNAFRTIDVGACMAFAARQGLLRGAAAPVPVSA
jgi:predicted polyphosphate/ATP-dependent NAD kinase